MKHIESEHQGLERKDFDVGARKLEVFKVRDKLESEKEQGKKTVLKRQMIAFEKDLIKAAQAYTVQASKRLTADPEDRQTYRKSLAEIYAQMREKHPLVIN